jgi:thiamine-monophosphate kinase
MKEVLSLTFELRKNFLNEEETIQLLWKVLSHGKRKKHSRSFDPFSDDVSWFGNPKRKKFVVSKSDMLVAETDIPRKMSPSQIASKAITSAVSDFAAKAVKPAFCMVSIAIPKTNATYDFVKSLAEGFDSACRRYGLRMLSGDTNGSGGDFVIDVTIIGFADRIVKRRGANPGEIVGVTGRFGLQSAGLSILLGSAKSKDKSFRRKAELSVFQPKARLSVGLRIGKYLTSCIDSSDGLALSLYHIAEASEVNVRLNSLPTAEGIGQFADQNDLREEDLVLFGGEEYELVMTFKPKYAEFLAKFGVIPIGETSQVKYRERPKLYFGSREIPRWGWLHNR